MSIVKGFFNHPFCGAALCAAAVLVLGIALTPDPLQAQQDDGPDIFVVDLGTFDLTTLSAIFPQFVFRPIDNLYPRAGGRAMGMGGAYLAVAKGAEALAWNPGGLAFMGRAQAYADIYSRSSSGSSSGYPLSFEFPDAPPLFMSRYEENLKSQIRFGMMSAAGPLFQLGSRPVVGGLAYRRHTEVAYPEEVIGEFLVQEGAGLPVIVATDVQEDGSIESATF
ncbi:MAG: hypothetical protein GF355_16960, partial [Candidatus Eisenbacteria bacterium]|nr:hypothetical protein [Candidatus Eisenbacteria bacterium]